MSEAGESAKRSFGVSEGEGAKRSFDVPDVPGLEMMREGVACVLILDRAECRNALSGVLIAELTEALRAAEREVGVCCVVITGRPPAFCAGLDLREVAEAGDSRSSHDSSDLLELYETIENLSKPVIAAVNGAAMAGGAGLVTVCDIAICGASATIGYPGIRHGLVAPIVMGQLCRLVGERQAKALLLTGEPVDAERALRIGLCNEVVEDERLMTRVMEQAELFARIPPAALAETKAAFNRLRRLRGGGGGELRDMSRAVPLSEESRAGLEEFFRK